MDYQWDPDKADLNSRNHGIDLADAVGVFEDEWALTIKQEIVNDEQRFATAGTDFTGRIVVVVYTYRGDGIRLISG
ncbi:MAG: BrnT family toxin [Spirochaetales bacterium]|nr:BrnT family toxin [Spirochaetales bacterium]